jgi:hypothetical protein
VRHGRSAGAGATCTVDVAAAPSTPGVRTATLSRTCTVGGTVTTSADQITVTGTSPSLAWTPLTHGFGSQLVGTTSAAQSFTLTNSGTASATSCSAPTLTGANAGDFALANDSCGTSDLAGANATCTIDVAAAPTTTGARTATLSRTCTVGGTVTTTADQITVTGMTPPVWSPSTQDYGVVAVNATSSAQTFTLTNSGSATLTGCSAPTLTGANAADFALANDTCGTNDLTGSGGTCTVDVSVTPSSSGTRTATLSRTCTAGGTVTTVSNGLEVSDTVKALHRSVGPGSTTALAVGTSNALTISGRNASFASALPDKIGVGDVIQYSHDNTSVDNLVFIMARTDSRTYTVQTVDGSIPTSTTTPDTQWSIFRAYTSLANALTGSENTGITAGLRDFDTWSGGNNVVTKNVSWHIHCYGDAVDDMSNQGVPGITNWTTQGANYLEISTPYRTSEVGVSQRHAGVLDTSKYYLYRADSLFNANSSLRIDGNTGALAVRLDGLQIWNDTAASDGSTTYAIFVQAMTDGDFRMSNNIIRGNTANSDLIGIRSNHQHTTMRLWNNLIYGFKTIAFTDNNDNADHLGIIYAYNNTIVDAQTAFQIVSNNDFVGINNVVIAGTACFTDGGTGNIQASSDYNSCGGGGGTAPGTHSVSGTPTFVNSAAGDYHLDSSDTVAKGAGTDLSADSNLSFTTTIDGTTRTVPWDIGAAGP